ncbi:MAG: hypothetical protein EOO38_10280 [Cytophagaceae bacterium]|nr:MAG: hypothetical protein EOO38_10280 [Cytophagaceae bacterium]
MRQIDEEIDMEYFEEEEDWEEDEEFGYAGERRIDAERRARPERENPLIEEAENFWVIKIAEQRSKSTAIRAALSKLFQHMPSLNRIELLMWLCNPGEYSLGDDYK